MIEKLFLKWICVFVKLFLISYNLKYASSMLVLFIQMNLINSWVLKFESGKSMKITISVANNFYK